MTWSYLEPHHSQVMSSPVPTAQVFKVQTGQGTLFIAGPARLSGEACVILSVVSDLVTLAAPAIFKPTAGDLLVQTVVGARDRVRLFCGDTDADDEQLQDEEIDELLLLRPNTIRAAAFACEIIAGKLARKVTYQIYQEIQERLTEQAKSYREQADRLHRLAMMTSTMPFAGGLLRADKDAAFADTTHVKPFFTREMMTEPGTELEADINANQAQPTF